MKKLKLFVSALLASTMIVPALSSCEVEEDPETAPSVLGVTFNQGSFELFTGDTKEVTASVSVRNNASKSLNWTVDKADYIDIFANDNGKCSFTALKAGTVHLTATSVFDDTKKATATITITESSVLNVKITEKSVSGAATELCKDQTITLNAVATVQGPLSTEVTWSLTNGTGSAILLSSSGTSCSIKGVTAGSVYITAKSKADNSVFDTIELSVFNPVVNSLTLDKNEAIVGTEETATVTATVNVKGTAENIEKVNWNIDNANIATISISNDTKTVTITPVAMGETTLTATSVFDESKTKTITLKVVDKGFLPELYDGGMEYSANGVNSDELKSFLGIDSDPYLPNTTLLKDEKVYVQEKEESDDYYHSYIIAVDFDFDDQNYEANLEALFDDFEETNGFTKGKSDLYDYSYIIDPTETYLVFLDYNYTNNYEYYIYYQYCFVEDLFKGSKTATTDNDWNENVLTAIATNMNQNAVIPFVALGKDYEAIVSEGEDGYYFAASDSAYNPSLLDGYADTLTGAGFTYVESMLAYGKQVDDYNSIYVNFGGEIGFGNIVEAYIDQTVFNEFPTTLANEFVASEAIGSQYQIKPFMCSSRTEGELTRPAEYRMEVADTSEEGVIPACRISGMFMDEDTFNAYIKSYTDDGFEVLEKNEEDYSYVLEKGYLTLKITLYPEMVFDWDTYESSLDADNSTVEIIAYKGEGFEEKGLWIKNHPMELEVGDEQQIKYYAIEIGDNPTINWTSSDSSVATVDTTGKVTAVAGGTATITGTINVEGTDYTATQVVNVKKEAQTIVINAGDFGLSNDTAVTSKTFNGVNVSFTTGTGSNPPKYYSTGGIRTYSGNTMTFTAPAGSEITSIKFENVTAKNDIAELTPDVGNFNNSSYTWGGMSASEVEFTVGSGQFRFEKVTVVLDGEATDVGGGSGSPDNIDQGLINTGVTIFESVFGEAPTSWASYDDEEAETDMYYYDDELQFVGFAGSGYIDEYSVEDIYNMIVDSLPGGATIDTSYDAEIEDDFYYDVWYTIGDYTIAVYALDYYGCEYGEEYAGIAYYFTVDIFYTDDADTYYELMYSDSEDEDVSEALQEVLDTIAEICDGIECEYDSDYDCYYNYYTSTKSTLSAACQEGCSKLPASYTQEDAPAQQTYDGETYYEACYSTDDGIYIYVTAYESEGDIVVQYDVYDYSSYMSN